MAPRRFAVLMVAVLALLWLLGLVDDLLRLVIWQAAAAAAMLIYYGPARRAWKGARKDD